MPCHLRQGYYYIENEEERTMENKELKKVIAEEMKGPVCCPMIHEIARTIDRKSTRLNSSHTDSSRMPSSA